MTTKNEAVAHILDAAGDTPTVFTTGYTCRIAQSLGPRPQDFYVTGSMGLVAAVGAGLAAALDRPVFVVDGDGSLLMNLSVLCTIGEQPDLPLTHIVLDDGLYASTGGQHTGSGGCDFVAMAGCAGYPSAFQVGDVDDFTRTLRRRAAGERGPMLARWRLPAVVPYPGPRVAGPLRRHAAEFGAAVRGARR
ncbi:thiamine pyrophosphate-dependent enzyme [Micromonospora sp. WMMD882]|uniref:thiamine pyrophosphate-dependent enzyme n=1 Tax=Micromonospora sp. WMMD882 TaxID=3015151 RepID=UPI00248ABE51|nr:thiamine pyrophosphate-dependent enzyme [Micromonospora sp. WMMD882]WBB78066.1 thiamine pyrophosphate-dependent enzyme [Micromonospora sp. WMMD882]